MYNLTEKLLSLQHLILAESPLGGKWGKTHIL